MPNVIRGTHQNGIYYKMIKGIISKKTRTERRDGIWQIDLSNGLPHLFITCPGCGGVNNVTNRLVILETGMTEDPYRPFDCCVTCPHCKSHFWPYLIGWDPARYRRACAKIKPKEAPK